MQQISSFVLAALMCACTMAQDENVYYSSTGEEFLQPFTETFASPDVIPELELSETSRVGLILGFLAVGLFIIYANIKVIIDEKKRHQKFEEDIEEVERTLQNEYKVDENELNQIKEEFAQMESGELGEKNGEEDADLADIN